MTHEEFLLAYGRPPVQDDLQRVNCAHAGNIGHSMCGICEEHQQPRLICGCLLINQRAVAVGPPVNVVPLAELDQIEAELSAWHPSSDVVLTQALTRRLIAAARELAKIHRL